MSVLGQLSARMECPLCLRHLDHESHHVAGSCESAVAGSPPQCFPRQGRGMRPLKSRSQNWQSITSSQSTGKSKLQVQFRLKRWKNRPFHLMGVTTLVTSEVCIQEGLENKHHQSTTLISHIETGEGIFSLSMSFSLPFSFSLHFSSSLFFLSTLLLVLPALPLHFCKFL